MKIKKMNLEIKRIGPYNYNIFFVVIKIDVSEQ